MRDLIIYICSLLFDLHLFARSILKKPSVQWKAKEAFSGMDVFCLLFHFG